MIYKNQMLRKQTQFKPNSNPNDQKFMAKYATFRPKRLSYAPYGTKPNQTQSNFLHICEKVCPERSRRISNPNMLIWAIFFGDSRIVQSQFVLSGKILSGGQSLVFSGWEGKPYKGFAPAYSGR